MSGYGLEGKENTTIPTYIPTVSILLCLDTVWKSVALLILKINTTSFNPLMSGYGLEVDFAVPRMDFKNSFNPLMSGYGLEAYCF